MVCQQMYKESGGEPVKVRLSFNVRLILFHLVVPVAESFQHPEIEFFIEKLGITHGFIGQKNANWQENESGHPHARYGLHDVFLYKFSSEVIQKKKDNKKYNGKDHGQSDAPFANDGAQGSSDQKQNQAGNGHGDFFVPGHQMKAQVLPVVFIRQNGNICTGFDGVNGGIRFFQHTTQAGVRQDLSE
jgi:hypothetical protein